MASLWNHEVPSDNEGLVDVQYDTEFIQNPTDLTHGLCHMGFLIHSFAHLDLLSAHPNGQFYGIM
jgi:hypothetical protein